MTLHIRPARADEIPALEQLIARSVRALSVGYYTLRQIELALVHVFGVDSQLIADGTYFVAEVAGQLAACGGWSKRRTLYGGDQMKAGEDNLLDPRSEAARIRAFFVDPAFARRGIGKQLLAACEAAARAAGFTRLEMGATLPGEPLYTAAGYRAVEHLAAPLPEGETLPIIRMEKLLPA
ncbi:MAG: GNAT family N-acetyltransferase [Acidobacteria bacterium]|nr:GNAT family N-acetyltransferase [Acidobacteriota bacterium]MBI3421497.1 GNAT family N-acetyltransferase [Acidobacteriota bacterium]